MFTGLIEEVGEVVNIAKQDDLFLLSAYAPKIAASSQVGDSVAINGCCLTIVTTSENRVGFHLLQETLDCTNFGDLQVSDPINCELPLSVTGRLGGHFVQGHVDCIARVISFHYFNKDCWAEIAIPIQFAQYLILKGSVAVNGVSLTVAKLKASSFSACILPHTLKHTNLVRLQPGRYVNLEFDMIAKYVERMHVIREAIYRK